MPEQEKELSIPQLVEKLRMGRLPRRQFMKMLSIMGISYAGIETIVAASSNQPVSKPHSLVNGDEDTTAHLQSHDQHLVYQTQGQRSALHNDYAEHAIVEDSMYPIPIVGRVAIIARKSLGWAATSDVQITVVNRVAAGNQLTVEWIATGLHTGDLPGLPATNRPFTLRGVTVAIRERGKIIREALYYDVSDLYRQLSQQK